MATTVNRKRSLSGSISTTGKSTKSEEWQVITDEYTEPETVASATGLPALGSLLSSTTMRVKSLAPEFEKKSTGGLYVWNVTVNYESPDNDTGGVEPENGTELWTLSGSMQNMTVKKALAQESATGSPDVGLLVGVKDDGTIEGGQWGEPSTTLSVTLYKQKSGISAAYITNCIKEVGKVNNDVFYGFAAGEVRLESITIPKKLELLWALQFEFAIKPNEAQADLPTYTKPDGTSLSYPRDVKGWEYAWLSEIAAIDGVTNDKKFAVEGLHIARFYRTSDFSALGLSGSLF